MSDGDKGFVLIDDGGKIEEKEIQFFSALPMSTYNR